MEVRNVPATTILLQSERIDELEARVQELEAALREAESALARGHHRWQQSLAGVPVRDVAETLGEMAEAGKRARALLPASPEVCAVTWHYMDAGERKLTTCGEEADDEIHTGTPHGAVWDWHRFTPASPTGEEAGGR